MSSYKQIKDGFPEPKTYHSGYDNKYAQNLGPTGSLVGMGLGAITGAMVGRAMD